MPIGLIGATLLGAGLASGASLVGSLLGNRGAKRANRTNIGLSREAMQHEVDFWKMQNEYNSPEKQMERLKLAGLNPNLVYGTGSVVGNSSSPPKVHRATVMNELASMSQPLGQLPNFTDLVVKQAQIDNIKADTDIKNQRSVNEGIKETLLNLSKETGGFKLELMKELRQTQVEAQKALLKKAQEMNRKLLIENELNEKLKEQGLSTKDPLLLRMFIGGNLSDFIEKVLNANYNMQKKLTIPQGY